MPITNEERNLVTALARMPPNLTKSRKETISNYKKTRNILKRHTLFWEHSSTITAFDEYVFILECPTKFFIHSVNKIWGETEVWSR